MSIENITAYRVFIASPGDLEKERKVFRQALLLYNETDAIHEGVLFIPVGWEGTLGGVGRPQSIINEDLRKCDFTVMLFWKRWGSAPDREGTQFSSGTEEEFYTAMECFRDPALPMRQVVTFFKAPQPKQLDAPDEQLAKVLEFRKRLEREKEHLFHVFDTTRSFEDLLRRHFSAWLRSIRQGGEPVEITTTLPATANDREEITASPSERPLLDEASRLADQGRRTEAEALLARAAVRGGSPEALIAYGRFLIRDGRLDQAKALLERAIEVAESQDNPLLTAMARRWIGSVLFRRGDLQGAEQMYLEALEINERLGNQEGIAANYGNLGVVLQTRGDVEGAERMHRKALQVDEHLQNLEGVARHYGNLGIVLRIRGDLDGAEQMHNRGLAIDERLQNREGMARHYTNLGTVLRSRGDTAGAEQMVSRALEINESLQRKEGIAINAGNLGILRELRGDLDGAEQMFRRALQISEELGDQEGIAVGYGSLGNLLKKRGDLAGAEQMYRRSLDITERLGLLEAMALGRRCLGLVFEAQGSTEAARAEFTRALEFFRRLGNPLEVAHVENDLERIAGNR